MTILLTKVLLSLMYICTLSLTAIKTQVLAERITYEKSKDDATDVVHVTVNTIQLDSEVENTQYYKVGATVKDIVRGSLAIGSKISFLTYVTNIGDDTSDPIAIFEDDCIKVFLNKAGSEFELAAEGQSIETLDPSACGATVPTTPVPVPTVPTSLPPTLAIPVVQPTPAPFKPVSIPISNPVAPVGQKPTAPKPTTPGVIVVLPISNVTNVTNTTTPLPTNTTVVTVKTTAPVPAPVSAAVSSSSSATFMSFAIVAMSALLL
jgi:hypothetical protein